MGYNLSATFSIFDKASETFNRVADSGDKLVNKLNEIGNTADSSMATVAQTATTTAQSTSAAAAGIDTCTKAIVEYDKSAMEAVYSTQELVDMGYKTEDALNSQAEAAQKTALTMEEANNAANEFRYTIEQQEAELEALQNAYVGVAIKLGTSSEQAQALKSDINDLTGILDENKKMLSDLEGKTKQTGETGIDAVEGIANALAAVGFTAIIAGIYDQLDDLTNLFSESESTIVKMTGATGEALDSMAVSMRTVYGSIDDTDLANTAAAIGELNTRLNLVDEPLTKVTTLFMEFADNTNSDVVTSIENVTQVMKRWNVDIDSTGQLLDKLTFASQKSALPVNQLSDLLVSNKAILDQMGYSLNESIALFASFELAGINTASAMTGFRTALSSGTISTMSDFEAIMAKIKDGTIGAADAADIFGARAGPELVDAIRNGALNLDAWVSSLETADGTLLKTAAAADTLSDKWGAASNNLRLGFTGASEIFNSLSVAAANAVNGFGEFLSKNEFMEAAVTGLVAGAASLSAILLVYNARQTISAVTTALSAVAHTTNAAAATADAVATTSATVATTGFTAALMANPIGLVVAGFVALTAAVAVLAIKMNEAEDEYYSLTATSKKQYDELQALNAEYEDACDVYGETSYVAQKLEWQIEDLTAEFESSRQTIEEYNEQFEKTITIHNDLISSYDEAMAKIDQESDSTNTLINKLGELASQSVQAAITQEQIQAILDRLNETLPDLSLNYEDVISNSSDFITTLKSIAEAEAAQRRYNEAYSNYVDMLTDEAALKKAVESANANASVAQEQYNKANQAYLDKLNLLSKNDPAGAAVVMMFSAEKKAVDAATEAIENSNKQMAEAQKAYDENIAKQQECIDVMAEYTYAQETAADATYEFAISVEQGYKAASDAVESVKEELEALIASYDKAYDSAYDSISGTVGMFQRMKTEVKISTDEMLANMLSQTEFINNYTNNLEYAAQYLSEGLIASLSDGSEESASYLQTLVNQLKRAEDGLSWTYGSAEEFADKMNAAYSGVEEAKDRFSGYVANMETDFGNSMDKIEEKLAESISDMDLSADAADAAQATIQAYINTIESMTDSAHDAAAALAAAVLAAINPGFGTDGSNTVNSKPAISVPIKAYASGTKNAENAFIAGEEGPELILGAGGSTVYTAEETERMFRTAVNNYSSFSINAPVPSSLDLSGNNDSERPVLEKKITLSIEGHGSIGIDNSMSEDDVVDILYTNIRPALKQVLHEELFNGGDSEDDY